MIGTQGHNIEVGDYIRWDSCCRPGFWVEGEVLTLSDKNGQCAVRLHRYCDKLVGPWRIGDTFTFTLRGDEQGIRRIDIRISPTGGYEITSKNPDKTLADLPTRAEALKAAWKGKKPLTMGDVIDGTTLRVLLALDEDRRQDCLTQAKKDWIEKFTPAQKEAISAYQSAQLRLKLQASEAKLANCKDAD